MTYRGLCWLTEDVDDLSMKCWPINIFYDLPRISMTYWEQKWLIEDYNDLSMIYGWLQSLLEDFLEVIYQGL